MSRSKGIDIGPLVYTQLVAIARSDYVRPCVVVVVTVAVVATTISFFPFCPVLFSVLPRPGRCVGAYEWGASLPDVTRRAGSHGGSGCRGWLERGDVGGVGGRVDGETLGGVRGREGRRGI